MADAAYTDFVDAAVIDPVVLVEIVVKEEPVGWTPVSGLTNSYQIIVDPFVSQDKTPGGILAEVVSVLANDIKLTNVTSPWIVEGTQNSFFYNLFGLTEQQEAILGVNILGLAVLGIGDSSFDTNALIIHVADTNDITVAPSQFDAVAMGRKMYFGTQSKVFNSRFYEPRIDDRTEISLKEMSDDVMFGLSKSVGSGSLKIMNGDGVFDKLFARFIWNNGDVTIRFGGVGLTFSQFQTVGSYKIEGDPKFDFNAIEFQIRDEQKLTEQFMPTDRFTLEEFPHIDPAAIGKPKPILFGKKLNITPIGVADTRAGVLASFPEQTDLHIYMVSDGAFGGVYSFDEVRIVDENDKVVATIPVSNGDWIQTTPADGTFAIMPKWEYGFDFGGAKGFLHPPTSKNVRVDATGVPAIINNPLIDPDPDIDWETSTDYLKYYGEIVGFIYTQILGLDPAKFNGSAARAVDAEFPYKQGLWIKESKQAKVYIRQFETGLLARTIRTLDGSIKPTAFSPVTDFSNLTQLIDVDIVEFNPSQQLESGKIFSHIDVLYDSDPSTGETQLVQAFEDRTRYLYLDGTAETRTLETALTEETDALDLAQRVRLISRLPTLRVTIPETGLSMMDANLVDRVQVTVARGPDASGAWTKKLMEIDTIERYFAPVPKVVLTLNDLLGIGSTVSRWVEADHPTWLSSTSEQRARAGYFSDANGLVDPLTASTREIKLWF